MFRTFSQEVHLDSQLPNLGVQLAALVFKILGSCFFPAGLEDAAGPFGPGLFPFGNLGRVDVEFLGDLRDGLEAFMRFERHVGFEFGVVSSSFAFHFACVQFGLNAALTHHNHSLATGPIFRVRLTISRALSEGRRPSFLFFNHISSDGSAFKSRLAANLIFNRTSALGCIFQFWPTLRSGW